MEATATATATDGGARDHNNGDLWPGAAVDTPPPWKRELMRKRALLVTNHLKQSGAALLIGNHVTAARTCIATSGLVAAMQAVFEPNRFRTESNPPRKTDIFIFASAADKLSGFSPTRTLDPNGPHHELLTPAKNPEMIESNRSAQEPEPDRGSGTEEFQYGPGIVRRIQSKFLQSLNNKPEVPVLRRPQPIKRAGSLELLDRDPPTSPTEGVFKAVPSQSAARPRPTSLILQKTHSFDSLSLAPKSPDWSAAAKTTPTLTQATPTPSQATPTPSQASPTPLSFKAFVKEDLVIIEKNAEGQQVKISADCEPKKSANPQPVPRTRRIPASASVVLSAAQSGELPAPDTVRNVKSIFESQAVSSSWNKFSAIRNNPHKENVNVRLLNEENRIKTGSNPVQNTVQNTVKSSTVQRSRPVATGSRPLKPLQRSTNVQEESEILEKEDFGTEVYGVKKISPVALENIRKEGISLKFNFSNGNQQQKRVGIIRPIPKEPPRTENVETAVPEPKEVKPQKAEVPRTESADSSIKTANLPTTADPKIVQNFAKEDLVPVPSGSRTRKRLQDSAPAVVFNFKSRKEIPDYISNIDAIQPYKDDDRPSLAAESAEASGDLPQQPCRIQFEGANIIINGKSSIKSQAKKRKTNISFNEALNKVFEYPSESSLHEDLSPTDDSSPTASENGPATAAAGFSNYVPRVQETFELGVTRMPSVSTPVSDQPVEVALPAPEATSWSAEDSPDLLF